ncbi:hypothetical protein [Paenibacillus sp. YYML68]|uniref:hypothetical protein n=1 Tax=Paenibacillus sp. YYML68 TaxID=2909250 RepID=UPI00248FEBDE|nr:hypothetical protein [Paenibacillus sp. YYML68]
MRKLMFPLQFHREPSQAGGTEPPAVAKSIRMDTIVTAEGVEVQLEELTGQTAIMSNEAQLNHDQTLFFEWGTIQFANPANTLKFSSIGAGMLVGEADAEGFTPGVVLWRIDGGTGYFQGAHGTITSNFLINLATNELIDNHFYVVYVP